MSFWTGVTAVTAYSPVLLKAAGYSAVKQNGLAGRLNTIGIVGTIISAHIVDRFGRRKCLIWGAFGLFAVNLIAASLYETYRGCGPPRLHPSPSSSYHALPLNLCYAATWGTVAFLIPTEIFPSEMRAQGNGFGITGWAIGVGWTVSVNPIMFHHLANRTYFLFSLVSTCCGYRSFTSSTLRPQTDPWSLSMFSTKSPLYSKMEAAYKAAGNGDALAARGQSISHVADKITHNSSVSHSESV